MCQNSSEIEFQFQIQLSLSKQNIKSFFLSLFPLESKPSLGPISSYSHRANPFPSRPPAQPPLPCSLFPFPLLCGPSPRCSQRQPARLLPSRIALTIVWARPHLSAPTTVQLLLSLSLCKHVTRRHSRAYSCRSPQAQRRREVVPSARQPRRPVHSIATTRNRAETDSRCRLLLPLLSVISLVECIP